MSYEIVELNLIPSGDVPVIHAAQYDKERPLMFALKLGEDDFNPTGYDLELHIRKVDNNIVTAASSDVSGNVVTFLTTEQMCACSGTNLGEIQITKDDLDIATLHFYLVVQRDVLFGGFTSESEISTLEDQINLITTNILNETVPSLVSNEVDEIAPDIILDEVSQYINDVGGAWELIGNLSLSSLTISKDIKGLTNTSFIDIYADVLGLVYTDITITDTSNPDYKNISITFDDTNVSGTIPIYIRFYNVSGIT